MYESDIYVSCCGLKCSGLWSNSSVLTKWGTSHIHVKKVVLLLLPPFGKELLTLLTI